MSSSMSGAFTQTFELPMTLSPPIEPAPILLAAPIEPSRPTKPTAQ
jgi:hypothetical protein